MVHAATCCTAPFTGHGQRWLAGGHGYVLWLGRQRHVRVGLLSQEVGQFHFGVHVVLPHHGQT